MIDINKIFKKICIECLPVDNFFKRKQEKRSELQFKLAQIIINSTDPEELKNKIVKETTLALKAYRCFFIEYDSSTNNFKKVMNSYNAERDALSMLGYDIENDMPGFAMKQKYLKSIVINDTEKYIKDNKLEGSNEENYFKNFNIKAYLAVRLEFGENFLGIIVVQYDTKKPFLQDMDLKFLENIAEHISIALYLSTLYTKEKTEKERERLLRSIISIMSETHNLAQITQKIFEILGKIYNAQTVFININSEVLEEEGFHKFLYQSNNNKNHSMDTKIYELPEFELIKNKIHYIPDTHNFIIQNNLENSPIEQHFCQNNIKSLILFPISHENLSFGLLIIHFDKPNPMTKDDLAFVRTVTDQLAIAIKQDMDYQKQRKRAERESILRDIISKIRSSLDLEYVKHEIVNQVGMFLKADRVAIAYFDPKLQDYIISKEAEYRSSGSIKTFIGVDFKNMPGFVEYIRSIHLQGKDIIFNDLEEYLDDNNLRGTGIEKFYREFGFISSVAINIYYGSIFLGDLVITFEHQRDFSNDEIGFIRTLADQAGAAIYQSQLYIQEKKTAERETLLRRIIESTRASLDIQEIKKNLLDIIGKAFNADRCYFRSYDKTKNIFLPPDVEYLSSPDIKSLMNIKPDQQTLKYFYDEIKKREKGSYPIVVDEELAKEISVENYFKSVNIKADYAVPIFDRQDKLTYLVLHYSKEDPKLDENEKKLLETIAYQIVIAFDQAIAFENTKRTAERETTLRQIIEIVRSSLDINKVKQNIVNEVGKKFNADRCFYRSYDKEKNFLCSPDTEYLSTEEIKPLSVFPYSQEANEYFLSCYKKGKELIISDTDLFLASPNPDSIKEVLRNDKIKSTYGFPIFSENEFIGSFAVQYLKDKVFLNDDDIELLRSIAKQIGIAIKQSGLYNQQQQALERERLIANILAQAARSFDINQIKQIVKEIGIYTKADRCYFVEVDTERMRGKPVDANSEYLASTDIKSIIGYDFPIEEVEKFVDLYLQVKDVVVFDYEKIREKNGEQKEGIIKYSNIFELKSGIGIPFYYLDKLIAVLAIEYVHKKVLPSDDELNFLRILGNQIGIVFNQVKLYQKAWQTAEREKVNRNIIEIIRSTLDKNKIKSALVKTIAEYFQADRVFFSEFDSRNNMFLPVNEYSEYLSSPDVKSFVNYDWSDPSIRDYIEPLIEKQELDIFDWNKYIKENPKNQAFIDLFEDADVKSSYNIPVLYQAELKGYFCIEFTHNANIFSEDDLEFVRGICNQTGIALKQAELYEKEKQTAEREKLLREIVEKMRSSLNIDEILTFICDEVARLFHVERATIIEFPDKTNREKWIIRREYKKTEVVKGLTDVPFDKRAGAYNGKTILDEGKNLVIDNIHESDTPDYYKKSYNLLGVKSALSVPIRSVEDKFGIIFLSETDYFRHWTNDEINLLQAIADQVYIAIKQAELYDKEKRTAERESLLREIISTIRSTLDIDKIKKQVVRAVCQTLNAERCYIIEYDKNSNRFLPVQDEYLSSPVIKSAIGLDVDKDVPDLADKAKKGEEIIVTDRDKYILENSLENTPAEKFMTDYYMESGFSVPIYYTDQLLGVLVIHYTTKKEAFTDEEVQLIRTLANQVGIALHQSELYNTVSQTAERERILRELISELKLFSNVQDAFKYLLSKMANIYNASRAVLIEVPVQENEEPRIGYEYIKGKSVPPIKTASLPSTCVEMFKNIFKTRAPVMVSDTKYLHPDNTEVQNFFKTYCIKSFLGSPLVRYNHETKLLGILFICDDKPRDWEEKDINLLKAVNESVVNVIWEILKTIELNRLRDTFVNTLAHDLQVPIIGDIKALEFMASRPDTQIIGTFKEIINESLNNDRRILAILKNLLESYQYESGKKEFKYVKTNWSIAVHSVIENSKNFADSKEISIETHIPDNLPEIKVDKEEISRVIYILLDNAITYTQNGGRIVINVEHKDSIIKTCISDNGPGIPPNIRELIFKRYEMTIEIERKIGAGISLYLAKQIVEAHRGRIWYTTEIGKGSTFCFTLPAS